MTRENNNNINNNINNQVSTCVMQTGDVTVVAPAPATTVRTQIIQAETHSAGKPAVAQIKGPRKSVSIILPNEKKNG